MRDFVYPRNVQPGIGEAFRQIRLILKQVQIPVLTNRKSLIGIAEGTSAYYVEGKSIFRYTKINGKLQKENVDEGLDEEQAESIASKISSEAVANAPRQTLTGTVEKEEDIVGVVRERLYSYDVGNPPPERFVVKYYLSHQDVIRELPLSESEVSGYVRFASFLPSIPNQTLGTHYTIFSFRHIQEGDLILEFSLE